MSDRLKDLATFNEEYEKLSDSRRNEFARLVNKLLRDTYVVRKKGEDASDYFALLSNRPLFESFFSFMDFSFEVDRDKEIVYVKSMAGRNRVRLGKFDTALVLVLRKLFIKKAREASSNDKIIVTLKDVIAEMKTALGVPGRISHYREALRKLKRHKIVDCPSEVGEESSLEIYPSIALLVPQEDFEGIEQRLSALARSTEKEDDTDEEAD